MDVALFGNLLNVLTIFILAIYLGVEVIKKVPSLLHTPLMSGSNAISGITVVGAILALGLGRLIPAEQGDLRLAALIVAASALFFAVINVVGGFVVTHRMLGKFRTRK
jgi:NAD(P) transhydrogenase subunit alpha